MVERIAPFCCTVLVPRAKQEEFSSDRSESVSEVSEQSEERLERSESQCRSGTLSSATFVFDLAAVMVGNIVGARSGKPPSWCWKTPVDEMKSLGLISSLPALALVAWRINAAQRPSKPLMVILWTRSNVQV
jgi:hypothetical protein